MATNNKTSSKDKNEGATIENITTPSYDSVLAYPLQLEDADRYSGLFTSFACMMYNGEAISSLMTRGASKDTKITTAPDGSIIRDGVIGYVSGKSAQGVTQAMGASSKTAGRVGFGVALASFMGMSYSNSLSEADKKEIKCIIALPTPSITSDYSFGWSEPGEDVAYAVMANKAFSGGSDIINTAKQAFGRVVNTVDAASFTTGIAKNSMKTQIFKDVGLRSFGFNYKFAPKTETEAETVRKIIRWFKYTAHPDYNGTNYGVLNYPYVFSIKHFITNANGITTENDNLPKHTLSVLESVSVTYGNNGFVNVFGDGRPTEISLDLKFKELFTLTRTDINEGF